MVWPQVSLFARLLLDLRGIEQGGDNRGRADSDRDASLYQLVSALLVGAVRLVTALAHARTSMAFLATLEAE
jgi:hypothetical protein